MKMVFLRSVEVDKQSYCDLRVVNNTEHHVAFKVLFFLICTHASLFLYPFFKAILDFILADHQFNVLSFPFLDRSKPHHLRSTLFDPILVLCSLGMHV